MFGRVTVSYPADGTKALAENMGSVLSKNGRHCHVFGSLALLVALVCLEDIVVGVVAKAL